MPTSIRMSKLFTAHAWIFPAFDMLCQGEPESLKHNFVTLSLYLLVWGGGFCFVGLFCCGFLLFLFVFVFLCKLFNSLYHFQLLQSPTGTSSLVMSRSRCSSSERLLRVSHKTYHTSSFSSFFPFCI